MKKEDCFYLGIITKPFGYKGELVIYLDVDDPTQYIDLPTVLVEMGNGLVPFFIEKLSLKNNNATIRLQDVSPEMALTLVKKELYLPLNLLPKLKGNKFYFHEVIDFDVIDSEKGLVGKIEKVLDYPAQPILQVLNSDNKEILIPIADDIVLKVDRKNKKMEVKVPQGLIELFL